MKGTAGMFVMLILAVICLVIMNIVATIATIVSNEIEKMKIELCMKQNFEGTIVLEKYAVNCTKLKEDLIETCKQFNATIIKKYGFTIVCREFLETS